VIERSKVIMNQLEMEDEIAERLHAPLKKEEPEIEKKIEQREEEQKEQAKKIEESNAKLNHFFG